MRISDWSSDVCSSDLELLDGGDHGTDVDERLGRDRLDVLGGHALAHHPLHPGQADADLVLDQLAERADAPVGEVVLVVEAVAGLRVAGVAPVRASREALAARQHRLALFGAARPRETIPYCAFE